MVLNDGPHGNTLNGKGFPATEPVVCKQGQTVRPAALVLPFFVYRVPEMIVSHADVAALMLGNLTPSGAMSRHRAGLALPLGMRGRKQQWAAKPRAG